MGAIERERHGDALDFIAETAAAAGIHAEIVQRYASIGDVAGLRYAVRCMCAHIRACRAGLQAIDALQVSSAARRDCDS